MSNDHEQTQPNLIPDSFPASGPGSMPLDWDWQNWWRCYRRGPVSGHYEGEATAPKAGTHALDLRVDIDPRYANSPVMDRVSGDFFRVYSFNWMGRVFKWRVYQKSWIVDNPTVNWSRCNVTITGKVRYWEGFHPVTTVEINIPWSTFKAAGPATVQFTVSGGDSSEYKCVRQSHTFRNITLEVDVCNSINAEPILPSYDTTAHHNRPSDLPERTLDIVESYREAGIEVALNPTRTIIDDSNPQFNTWSPAELHDAMEQNFSRIRSRWPNWHMWCLLAGTFDSSGVGGIMFDAKAAFGGAGEAPERQGCAVFRNHSWFNNLVENPGTQTEAAAMRKLLYTYVHEMGHAFNFLHSWDKGRPDALSWMNYDWRYDNRNGADTFWANFEMRFDDEELIHIRHGNRDSVIMGGDEWASGGHLEDAHGGMATLMGQAPIELLVRSPVSYFDFMQPVMLEFRLRNLTDLPIELDINLHPELGGLVVYVRRPDGRTVQYAPVLCKLATPNTKILKPLQSEINKGEDRYSENVYLSFGADGFYFDEPGEYLVKAVYQGSGNVLIPSNVCRVRIGRPFSREEDRIAQDYFNYVTGLAVYLGGSSSPFLQSGMDTLNEMVERFPKSRISAQLALTLAHNLQNPFFRANEENKLVIYREAQPEQVLKLTKQVLDQQKQDDTTLTNLSYHQTRRLRAQAMVASDNIPEAKRELKRTIRYLKDHGVNKPVLDDIDAYAESL